MKQFSILIPAFKSKYLREAIESCLNQTFNDFEVIIVNDHSPEDLAAVVNEFDDDRIKYYENEVGCGAINVVDNWNICLGHSNGKYVICMGDDDRLKENCLSELAKLQSKYPGLGVYHTWTEIIDDKGDVYNIQLARPEWEGPASLIWHRWHGRSKQFIGDFCYDANELKKAGGFYKLPLAWGSDDISAARAAFQKGIANTQVPCFQYRENRLSITRTGNYQTKVHAAFNEQNWYKENLVKMDHDVIVPQCLEDNKELVVNTERLFVQLIGGEHNAYFTKKIRGLIIKDFKQHPAQLFYWYKHGKEVGLSKGMVMKQWMQALKLRILHP